MSVRGYIDIWYPYWQRGMKTKKVLSTLHGSWHVKTNHEKFKFIQSIWSKNKKVVFSPHLYKNYFFRGFCPIFGRFWPFFNAFWAFFGHFPLIFGHFWPTLPSKLSFTLIYIRFIFFECFFPIFGRFWPIFNTFLAIFALFLLIFGSFWPFLLFLRRERSDQGRTDYIRRWQRLKAMVKVPQGPWP